jgi:hypothetical protein
MNYFYPLTFFIILKDVNPKRSPFLKLRKIRFLAGCITTILNFGTISLSTETVPKINVVILSEAKNLVFFLFKSKDQKRKSFCLRLRDDKKSRVANFRTVLHYLLFTQHYNFDIIFNSKFLKF